MSFSDTWFIVGLFATFIVIAIQYNSKMANNAIIKEMRRKESEKEYQDKRNKLIKDLQGFETIEQEMYYRKIDKDHIEDAEVVE